VLIIADTKDGKEQEIAARSFPEHIAIGFAPVWSADDERIAFAVEGSDSHGSFMKAVTVSVADKREFPLSSRRWLSIGQMAWMPGDSHGDSLVMTAQEEGSSFTQLWQFDSGQSEAHKLTDDLADYLGVNVSANGSSLVTVRREMLTSVWTAPESATNSATQVTTGAGRYFDLSWTPDNKIIYASDARGSADIWEMNPDSTGQRQLTAGAGRNYAPVASPDNRYIVFHSDRSGEWQIWRMTRAGDDPVQLTPAGEDSNWAQITPDGQSVIYERTSANAPVALWRIPLAGGEPVRVIEGLAMRPSVSHDGKSIAYWRKEDKPGALWQIAIKPLDESGTEKLLDAPQGVANGVTILRWTRDDKAIMYLDYRNTTTIVWRQPLDGSAPTKMFESTGNVLIHSFASSTDGQFVMSRGLMINDAVIISNAANRSE
jgi:Tol biopolymer transport system component